MGARPERRQLGNERKTASRSGTQGLSTSSGAPCTALKEPTGTEQAQPTLPQLQPRGFQLSVPLGHPIPEVYCIERGSSSINRLVGRFF